MAYVDPILNEDEEKKKAEQDQGEGISTTPESSVISSEDTSASQAPNQGPGGQKGWTNLQTYVKANEDQSGKLGEEVGAGISNKVQELENKQQQYSNQYKTQKPTYDKGADAQVLGNIASGNIVANQPKISDLYNAKYTGPKSTQDVEGYSDINTGYSNLKADDLNTDQGKIAALQSIYGSGNKMYKPGEQSLDSFILGAGEKGVQALQTAQNSATNSKNAWKKVLSDVSSDISSNQQYYDQLRDQAQQAVKGKLADYSNTFSSGQKALDAEDLAKSAELQSLQESLSSNPNQAYSKLGLDSSTGNFLAKNGFDFDSLYNPTGQRKLGDTANEQDVKGYQALAELAGQAPGFNFSKTGNAANSYSVDAARAQQAAQAQQLNTLVAKRLQQEQAQRDTALAEVKKYASPLPKTVSEAEKIHGADLLGISREDYQKALDNNIDINKYIEAGKKLNVGDVASDKERSEWDAMRSALGLSASPSYKDVQDEGKAYSVNNLLQAIQAIQPPKLIPSAVTAKPSANFNPKLGVSDIVTPGNFSQYYPNGVQMAGGPAPSAETLKALEAILNNKSSSSTGLGQANIMLPR